MPIRFSIPRSATVLGLMLSASPLAFAGVSSAIGSITYAPAVVPAGASPVPTLSAWGLVAMVLLLSVVLYRVLRTHLGGKPLASVVLAGALGLGAASGIPALKPAFAAMAPIAVSLDNSAGASTQFSVLWSGAVQSLQIVNGTSVAQKINTMTLDTRLEFVNDGVTPQCAQGLVLPAGKQCSVGVQWVPVQ